MMTRLASLLLVCLTVVSAARADDWPQWRGPNRDDVSKEKGLLKSWPKDGPKLLWTHKDAGAGYSGMAVVGDRVYTLFADDKNEYILALDVDKGTKVWATDIGPRLSQGMGDGPRSTPTVDGDFIYALSGKGELACVKAKDGEKVWHVSLPSDLGGKMMSGWGWSESPLVDGDKVICTPGGEKGVLAALDKKKGTVLWRSKGKITIKENEKNWSEGAGYSSIVPLTVNGVKQYVQRTGNGVAGVREEDGQILWWYEHEAKTAAVPTPVLHDNEVYITSAYNSGCALVKVTADGKNFKAERVYDKDVIPNMQNQHGGVVLIGDYIYGFNGGNNGPNKWVCQEFKTGKVSWSENDKRFEKGSVTYADGNLYLYGQNSGTCVLLEANPKEWREHGRFTVPDKGEKHRPFWAHPTVANGRLYLRSQDLIFCYDIKDSK
jgi:outer membrane protein assembly factor BamB